MATSSITSPLTQDSDFAAELLLNRVMNGQAESTTGKTITAANRALATEFDATGYSYGVIAENIAYGRTAVSATQDALTELVSQVKRLGELSTSPDNLQNAREIASEIKNNLDAILNTNVHGKQVLQNQGLSITIGIGPTEVLDVGNVNISTSSFGTLYNSLTNLDQQGLEALPDLCSKSLDQLYGAISVEGARYQILSNRYDMFNDLISTFHKASDDETKQAKASDYTLLDIVS